MEINEFNIKPFSILDKGWALVTAGTKENFNMMTISWGGFGTLWYKPVITTYIRKHRYTYEFLEKNEYYTITIFDDEYKKDLSILGSKTGKDTDKLSETTLTPKFYEDNVIGYNEAKLTIKCRKIHTQDLITDNEEINKKFNENEQPHAIVIGEVLEIIEG